MTETRKKKRKRITGGVKDPPVKKGRIKVTFGDDVIKSTTTTPCGVKIIQKDIDDVREKLMSLGIDKKFFNNPQFEMLLRENCGHVDSAVNDWLMFNYKNIAKVMNKIKNNSLDATEIFELLTNNNNNVEQTISMIDNMKTAFSSLSEAPPASSSLPPPAPSSLTETPGQPPSSLPPSAPSSLTETPGQPPSSLTETPGQPPSSLTETLGPPPQEEADPYYTKNEFSVVEFYTITKGQYTLKDAIELLKNPEGILDPVTRKKVEIIRMVKNGRDAIDNFDKDPTIFKANGDEQQNGYWKVILKLNNFLSGIENVNAEEKYDIGRIYDNKLNNALEYLPYDKWLQIPRYELLKQKLEFAFFLDPLIKKLEFKNINDLVSEINTIIHHSKGLPNKKGGKHTRRRKLFRHKTRHAVNRL